MDEEWNINGSYASIEGITSPDGRCFGKMAQRYIIIRLPPLSDQIRLIHIKIMMHSDLLEILSTNPNCPQCVQSTDRRCICPVFFSAGRGRSGRSGKRDFSQKKCEYG